MKIEKTGNAELTITGNIKSIDDSTTIKHAINALVAGGSQRVVICVKDSFSMTSAVIGTLMKLVNHDQVDLSMTVTDHRLYTLLDSLNLIQMFKVTQISS